MSRKSSVSKGLKLREWNKLLKILKELKLYYQLRLINKENLSVLLMLRRSKKLLANVFLKSEEKMNNQLQEKTYGKSNFHGKINILFREIQRRKDEGEF